MNKYAVLAGLAIVILVVGLFGAHFGYTVNGVPQGAELGEGQPGFLGALEYAFAGIAFLVSMAAFRVDGMPVWISSIFIFMAMMAIMLIASLVRGTE